MMARGKVTDRAHRYRANQLAPVAGKVCLFCGSTSFLVPDHWDGHPDHTHVENLEVLCKACNTAKGAAFKTAGRGRLTKQFNPTKGGGAANVGEWMQAVGSITPHVDRGDRGLVSTMSTRDAVDMIRATSQSKRRDFAAKMRRRNPWFSRPDARRTTPASGGIAHHMAKRRPSPVKKAASDRAKSKTAAAAGAASLPDEKTLAEGFKRGLSLADMLRANPAKFSHTITPERGGYLLRVIEKRGGKKIVHQARQFGTKSAASDSWRDLVRRSRKNPAGAAAEVFQEFHGFEPSEVITVTKKVHYHKHLAAAGELVQLDVWGIDEQGHKISGFKGAFLAFNESKNQLFVEGGDQRIDLADFGIDSAHELETLGRLTDIGYHTKKTHLGDEGGEAVYVHKFRSTNRNGKHVVVKIARYPDLIYDVRNEQLLFSGGSYEIIAEGINK